MDNAFFCSFIDDGLGRVQLNGGAVLGFFLGSLTNGLHHMLDPSLDGFVSQPFGFGLFGSFERGFMICQC